MPSSTAAATFSFKNLRGALPPADTDISIATVLRKKHRDLAFSLSFTDASLKDPASGRGVVVGVEKPFGGTAA